MKDSAEMSVDAAQSGLSWQGDSCSNSRAVDRGGTYWTPVNNSNITISAQNKNENFIEYLKFNEV